MTQERNEKLVKWLETTDPRYVREFNRRRKALGKMRLILRKDPNAPKQIGGPFVLFVSLFSFFPCSFSHADDD